MESHILQLSLGCAYYSEATCLMMSSFSFHSNISCHEKDKTVVGGSPPAVWQLNCSCLISASGSVPHQEGAGIPAAPGGAGVGGHTRHCTQGYYQFECLGNQTNSFTVTKERLQGWNHLSAGVASSLLGHPVWTKGSRGSKDNRCCCWVLSANCIGEKEAQTGPDFGTILTGRMCKYFWRSAIWLIEYKKWNVKNVLLFYSFRMSACSSFIFLSYSHAQRTRLCSTHSFNTWWRSWENQRRGWRRWKTGWRRSTPCWLWCHGALVKVAGSWRRCSRCCGQPDTAPWKRRGSWARCFALGATLSSPLTAPPLWDFRGISCWGMHPKYKVVWACKNKPLSLYCHEFSYLPSICDLRLIHLTADQFLLPAQWVLVVSSSFFVVVLGQRYSSKTNADPLCLIHSHFCFWSSVSCDWQLLLVSCTSADISTDSVKFLPVSVFC